jgi:Ankyrin repeats (3 copies)/Ankyrin repeats (many copies)
MTNPAAPWASALLFLAACSAGESSIRTNPEPGSSAARFGAWTPPVVSAAAPTPSAAPTGIVFVTPPSDEPLIREFQTLARDSKSESELQAFVSAHPHLLEASARPYGPTIMWLLEYELEQGALVLYRAGAKTPPDAIVLAARGGLDTFIDALLANGVDPNGGDSWGYTPLHAAAKQGEVSTVKKLLAAKAKPSVSSSNDGFTPLHIAVIEHKEEIIPLLLKGGADIESMDHNGKTPLHWGPFAYRAREMHVYEEMGQPHDTIYRDPGPARGIFLLLDAGAKINAIDKEGNTPLHQAAYINSVRGAEALLARGANVNIKNKAGETPLSIAKASAHRAPVLKVLQRGR